MSDGGREVCVGLWMAAGPGSREGLTVVDGILRHASVPVFRPLGEHWEIIETGIGN